VHKGWAQKLLIGTIFIDIIEAFDYIDLYKLSKAIEAVGLNNNLIR
jgi:hypothetical protein